jgi:hypothetical protein
MINIYHVLGYFCLGFGLNYLMSAIPKLHILERLIILICLSMAMTLITHGVSYEKL